MRKLLISLAAALCCLPSPASDWYGNKYSMFIHFGVYSSLGGVWKGKPVTYGYSEQIQACGGIYADQYEGVAEAFNPVDFNADDIVALAKAAGMRSIVMTSKHHDGFCMWDTATTDYDSVDWAVCGRDFVGEMAAACERGGISFGLYYSLIDWHFPYGSMPTTHNANYILPQHHEYNKAQVREICTKYGKISELWFDMGSLTPRQSKDMYDLVHELQPGCMVSGRLGNDMYDFSVMGDNQYPDGVLQVPWQCPASMFNETWGYRSWQKRIPADEKVAIKLRQLMRVVSQGGNYLLNIGPDDKGAVVPYEREVLTKMGGWIARNADVIYDTGCSPYRDRFEWGVVTRKDENLNLILTGKYPEGGVITLPDPDNVNRTLKFKVSPEDYADPCDIKVIRHKCRSMVEPMPPAYIPASTGTLTCANALKDYSFSMQDYYIQYLSSIAYNWHITGKLGKTLELLYTPGELGRKVRVDADSQEFHFALAGNPVPSRTIRFTPVDSTFAKAHKMKKYSVEFTVTAPEEGDYLFEAGSGNTIDIYVDGAQVVGHINPYRTEYAKEFVLLHLHEGANLIKVECSNRHEKSVRLSFAPCTSPLYRMTIPIDAKGVKHLVRVTAEDRASIHEDCKLHNLRIGLDVNGRQTR